MSAPTSPTAPGDLHPPGWDPTRRIIPGGDCVTCDGTGTIPYIGREGVERDRGVHTQQCFMCGGYGYHAQQLIEPDPRHNEVSAMREAAEARKRSLEESVAALKEKTRKKLSAVVGVHPGGIDPSIDRRIRTYLLSALGPAAYEALNHRQYAVKQGDRCPRCSTPARLRQMTNAEIAATEGAADFGVAFKKLSRERWEAAGRVCPDPKCARIFLEISGDIGMPMVGSTPSKAYT